MLLWFISMESRTLCFFPLHGSFHAIKANGVQWINSASDAFICFCQTFSRDTHYKSFCLAHLFTHQAFEGGVLGLAYIGSPRTYSIGGICSPGEPTPHAFSSCRQINAHHVVLPIKSYTVSPLAVAWVVLAQYGSNMHQSIFLMAISCAYVLLLSHWALMH